MPETLLSLYQNSDAIYIATFDKKADGEITEDTPDYTALGIKKHFSISSTLKGESRKFFVLDDNEYRYKNTVPATGEVEEGAEAEDPESSVELKPGDTLLLFLKNGDEKDAPTLTDYRDGTKKLSMDRIGIYESRIKELNSIFSAKKVDEAKIVEWLVRCAEDPVTRWEGTFELLSSFQNVEWLEQAAEQRKARIERGEPVEEGPAESETPDEDGEEEDSGKNVDTSRFANLLDANQKQTLANILLNRESPPANDKEETAIAGDDELIELVKRFGDPRLVGFLIEQVRASTDEPDAVGQTMKTIAEILGDKEIASIADKYNEIAYEDDADEAADVDSETVEEGQEGETKAEPAGDVSEPEADEENAENPDRTENKKKKFAYKEMRNDLLQKFLSRSEGVISGIAEVQRLEQSAQKD
ncbi:MAG: hypothetical protein ABIU09_02545 [Pyrinomonadaceae bacterium]